MTHKALLVPLTLFSILFLAACQPAAPQQPQTNTQEQNQEEDDSGKLIIEQVYPPPQEGEESVTTIRLGGENDSAGSVRLPGVKGMAFTEDGFMPDAVTIATGEKVMIQNRLDEPVSLVSENCPELSKDLQADETYEMTLNEAAACVLSDSADEDKTATITVE